MCAVARRAARVANRVLAREIYGLSMLAAGASKLEQLSCGAEDLERTGDVEALDTGVDEDRDVAVSERHGDGMVPDVARVGKDRFPTIPATREYRVAQVSSTAATQTSRRNAGC